MAECPNHSGLVADIGNIKGWQKNHEKEHETLDSKVDKLQNRLPVWATLAFSGMGAVIGYLIAIIQITRTLNNH